MTPTRRDMVVAVVAVLVAHAAFRLLAERGIVSTTTKGKINV